MRSSFRPTPRVATYQSPTAITACSRSFLRADRPSERFFEIFVQSSRKPRNALATAVPNTAMLARSCLERMRNGTETAMNRTIPPMVGVPAFTACPAGPSSRMCWPNSRARSHQMNFGERKTQMSSEAVPAMSTSPMARGP